MAIRKWQVLVGAASLGLAIVASAEPGVTPNGILVGQSAALTGPASDLGQEMRKGILAYFERVNKAGGINGRQLTLKSLDDGYEATRAAANTHTLIETDQVFALLGYVGTPTSEASKPIFTAAKVPFVGPFTGAELLRTPVNRYIFNIRASYNAETEALVNLVTQLGLKRVAVFYQNDSYGKAGLAGVDAAMKKRNLQIAGVGTVERNSVDVANAVHDIAKIEPQAVIMISAYKSCAAFIREMKKADQNPQFMNVSFVGTRALADELGDEGRGVGISQVVPFPWNLGSPLVREYQHDLAESTGKSDYNFGSLEGYIAARVFVEGLRRAGPNLTRERFVDALESLHNLDVGGFPVSYTSAQHNGSNFVELTVIGKDRRILR